MYRSSSSSCFLIYFFLLSFTLLCNKNVVFHFFCSSVLYIFFCSIWYRFTVTVYLVYAYNRREKYFQQWNCLLYCYEKQFESFEPEILRLGIRLWRSFPFLRYVVSLFFFIDIFWNIYIYTYTHRLLLFWFFKLLTL